MIKGINHVGISVANLERSIAFYRDVLGMEVVVAPVAFGGEQYERILALEGVRGRVALLKANTLQLELFEFEQPRPRSKDQNHSVADHGITHFCIDVADLKEVYARLTSAGVRFHCEPLYFFGTARATYARDPDGNVFELLEMRAGN